MMERCRHGKSAPQSMLLALPDSQGGRGRHKCPNCAYEEGRKGASTIVDTPLIATESCQHHRIAPANMLSKLPESQGGSGRHKCCVCAYAQGLADVITETVPTPQDQYADLSEVDAPSIRPRNTNASRSQVQRHVDQDQQRETGLRGEFLVLKYETNRLAAAGRPDLASRVEHVAVTMGDGLGYDILSFEEDGDFRHIEVKTTVGTKDMPFYLTKNELDFSRQASSTYFLYRVFDLNNHPQFFVIVGDLEVNLYLEPYVYRAFPQ